ncbi:response regulator transcription factor [Caldisalinibacter kiritimatiensis]|uniref:DNA-binding response regulator n=1 Tax=Caldisalinibacter kiritimatiensis TaxID=1304284 RepID=R1ARE3_9FIRM|nr:response regulator [Caldisalinibacter kiritimatiensis]EOC99266.1 DNA-binding response regulator [Caldisalinibacter kiritimatiensis]
MTNYTTKTVAIVDDDPYARQMITELLIQYDFKVIEYSSGEEVLSSDISEIKLVILDVMMPGMDGFETCRKLKEKYDDRLPIIMLTALDDKESKKRE